MIRHEAILLLPHWQCSLQRLGRLPTDQRAGVTVRRVIVGAFYQPAATGWVAHMFMQSRQKMSPIVTRKHQTEGTPGLRCCGCGVFTSTHKKQKQKRESSHFKLFSNVAWRHKNCDSESGISAAKQICTAAGPRKQLDEAHSWHAAASRHATPLPVSL
jgi:hypothetical protein